MGGSSLQQTVRMEQFQTAFVHALAAVNGWRIGKPDPDYDGIDLEISGTCAAVSEEASALDPKISIQLKATSSLRALQNGLLSYDLDVKNYNQLIGNRYSTQRYLFILDIPDNCCDWWWVYV